MSIPRPDFFIVGAPKSGTSSLAQYLQQHPRVFMPKQKDLPFFGSDIVHNFEGAFNSLTEYEARAAGAPSGALCGEASVQYLYSTNAASEIRRYNPNARIIIMLRDPVEMIYSLHSHNLWMREEDIDDFRAALDAEPRRRKGELIPPVNHFAQGLFYRDIGHIYRQVVRYLDVFGDDRVRVIVYDDFAADTEMVTRQTFSFLGLIDNVSLELRVVNANRTPRSRTLLTFTQRPHPRIDAVFTRVTPRRVHGKIVPWMAKLNAVETSRSPLDSTLASQLRAEFAPDVRQLSERLGLDLGAWTRDSLHGPR